MAEPGRRVLCPEAGSGATETAAPEQIPVQSAHLRRGSGDFNAPDEATCLSFLDRAILEGGINLIDTAEQRRVADNSMC